MWLIILEFPRLISRKILLKAWQIFAIKHSRGLEIFAIINTKVFLGILFIFVISIYGIFFRILRIDLLRLKKHNAGTAAKSTRGYKWKIIYKKKFHDKSLAMSYEYKLKKNKKKRKYLLSIS